MGRQHFQPWMIGSGHGRPRCELGGMRSGVRRRRAGFRCRRGGAVRRARLSPLHLVACLAWDQLCRADMKGSYKKMKCSGAVPICVTQERFGQKRGFCAGHPYCERADRVCVLDGRAPARRRDERPLRRASLVDRFGVSLSPSPACRRQRRTPATAGELGSWFRSR